MRRKRGKALVNCEAGRRMGCQSFCCRLIVRLDAEECSRGVPGVAPKMGCVPKEVDGHCVHFDKETSRCRIWHQRPRICREYDCNSDELLQVVLRRGFSSLTALVYAARRPEETKKLLVPRLDEES